MEYLQMFSTIEETEEFQRFTLENHKFSLTESGDLSVSINEPKFENGKWYAFKEPGQEKLLVRVDDAERMICSGWNCKGQVFHEEWMYLGNRLIRATWDNVFNSDFWTLAKFYEEEKQNVFPVLDRYLTKDLFQKRTYESYKKQII